MENSMSRILIETTVRQTLKGLQDDPKRSIRNVVNMALHFSDGRFQSRFSGLPRPCWNRHSRRQKQITQPEKPLYAKNKRPVRFSLPKFAIKNR